MPTLDTEYDKPEKLLSVVGSFWRNVYAGNFAVETILHSRAQLDAEAHLRLLDLLASMSRFTLPVFHTRNWFFSRLLESDKNDTEIPVFGGPETFTEASPIRYGTPKAGELHAWAVPPDLVGGSVVLNRITDASLTLTHGVDFTIADGAIRFLSDPFADDRVPKREIVSNGQVVDRECGLWIYRGWWDWDTVYTQFGYALGIRLASSDGYKQLVNAVFDALVEGTTVRSVQEAMSAVCGIPLAKEVETVEEIWRDDSHLWIVTDKNAYSFAATAVTGLIEGQLVGPGDPLVNGLRFFDLNRGHPTVSAGLRAVAVGKGLLAAGFHQDVMFEDKTVATTVTTDANDRTRISWPMPAFPGDLEEFFDRCHPATGQTLAQLLDTRPAEAKADNPEPPPAALPATINPLRFLSDNVLRNNAFVVHCRPSEFGPTALGLGVAAQVLRRVVPPQTLCIVLAELSVADVPVMLVAPGTDESPGGEEYVTSFAASRVTEDIDPALVSETVRARSIVGRCE